MSEAPERIYLDGDVEAGDGMFPRCFENPKYASEPPVEYLRADHVDAMLKAEREKAIPVAASLAAAISLLERGGKVAAPSNKMFEQMLKDYRRSLDDFRALIEKDATDG